MEVQSFEDRFEHLTALLAERLGEEDLGLVRRAYEVARAAHEGQLRDEGTPYIIHPIRVATLLVEELHNYSTHLICAALLHDVIEDSDITRKQIARMFGK